MKLQSPSLVDGTPNRRPKNHLRFPELPSLASYRGIVAPCWRTCRWRWLVGIPVAGLCGCQPMPMLTSESLRGTIAFSFDWCEVPKQGRPVDKIPVSLHATSERSLQSPSWRVHRLSDAPGCPLVSLAPRILVLDFWFLEPAVELTWGT